MVSLINFGNFTNIGGRNVSSTGIASGLNTKELVESLVKIKQAATVDRLTTQKTDATAQVSALSELKTIIGKFKTAANALRSPPGLDGPGQNAFKTRLSTVTSNTSVAGDTYLTVTAKAGAALTTYNNITVTSVAQAKSERSVAFTSKTADATTGGGGPVVAGTLIINGTNVTISAGNSLETIRDAINAVKATTNVEASIIQAGTTDFRLVLSSTKTGVANAYTVTANATSASFGLTALASASDAIINLNGINIQRATNEIGDAVTDLTFNVKSATPGGTTLTATINPDREVAKKAILSFVDTYNEFKLFAAKQQLEDSPGVFNKDAILGKANSTSLGKSLSDFSAELSKVVGGLTAGDPSRLSELGITFIDYAGDQTAKNPAVKNILTVDEAKLTSVLTSDFDKARKVLEFDFTTPAPTKFAAYTRTNAFGIPGIAFTIDVDKNRAVGDQVRMTYDPGTGSTTVNTDFSYSGTTGTITGKAGTVFEGLVLVYIGAGVDVAAGNKITHGISDRIWNATENITKSLGTIENETTSLNTKSTNLQKDIDKANADIEFYRETLLNKFSEIEAAVVKANSILQLLGAQAAARESK